LPVHLNNHLGGNLTRPLSITSQTGFQRNIKPD